MRPAVPVGWSADAEELRVRLEPGQELAVPIGLTVGPAGDRRARVAVDVTIGDLRLGQHAEAIVLVRRASP